MPLDVGAVTHVVGGGVRGPAAPAPPHPRKVLEVVTLMLPRR